MSDAPHVVIVGGGFGGLNAAKRLARSGAQVTLVDRRNHHLFQPLLYQVASAALNPSDIAAPIRAILRDQKNVRVLLAEVIDIDVGANTVELYEGALPFDYLVLAAGATHSYFGNDAWANDAPGLKTIEDALEIRRRVLLAYEAAERESDPERQRALLTFVIIGGGPTGTELAGALSEISKQTLSRNFRNIDPQSARVILLQGGPRVLETYPEALSAKALKQLEGLGVEVRLNAMVTSVTEHGVRVGDAWLAAETTIWAAGVRGSSLGAKLGTPLDRAGRVLVEADLSVPGHPNIFVAGDMASLEQDGAQIFGTAPAAIQAARLVAANVRRLISGEPTTPFRYKDKGSLATIGRSAAVADLGWVKLSGTIAWLAWLVIHVFFLIGFRRRLMVVLSWAWSYLTRGRGARLITGEAELDVVPNRPLILEPEREAGSHEVGGHPTVERPSAEEGF